jgi:hypothetical protein
LLTADRPEVYITAGWGLRKLAVSETLPAVVRYLETELGMRPAAEGGSRRKQQPVDIIDHQFSQLNQFLGRQKYQPADAVLREFVPRMHKPVGQESRAAAIWALGLIHEGKPEATLVKAVTERLDDSRSRPPEDFRVRSMSAVALARMGAKDALPIMRAYNLHKKPSDDPINNACGWAIAQLTGEPLLAPDTIRKVQRDWFLGPNR